VRRYVPTILILVALLVVGGLALTTGLDPQRLLFKGTYVPNMSAPLNEQGTVTAAMILAIGVPVALISVIGLGVVLAITFQQITKMEAQNKAKEATASPAKAAGAAPAAKSAPAKAAEKAAAPAIPLTSGNSLTIFWVVLSVIVVGFMVLKYAGQRGVYVPALPNSLEATVLTVPRDLIEKLAEGVPALKDWEGEISVGMLLPGILLGSVLVALGAGFGLARGWSVLDGQVKTADQLPRTAADQAIAAVDQRVNTLLATPFKPGLPGANLWDQILIGLNIVLVLVILIIIGTWVLPSVGGVNAVDAAVEGTRVAALATPTPKGKTALEALQEGYAALPAGDASAGETTFTAKACVSCHSLQADVTIVGPSQAGVASRAEGRKPGYSPELYLYESIISPSAYLVEGFQDGLMPKTFRETLSSQELADLIAFLMTLK
jgi:hypothetical protein